MLPWRKDSENDMTNLCSSFIEAVALKHDASIPNLHWEALHNCSLRDYRWFILKFINNS